MQSTAFLQTFDLISRYGYFLLFIAMFIEGPLVTVAAAFAAALGIFNPFTVLALAIAGDLAADITYYAIGYLGRITIIEKWGRYLGLTQSRAKKIEKLLDAHAAKTIVALKLTPLIPAPGLMLVGASRLPLKKYSLISIMVTLPKAVLFVLAGYYYGRLFISEKYLQHPGIILFALLAFLAIIYYAYSLISARLAVKIENLNE